MLTGQREELVVDDAVAARVHAGEGGGVVGQRDRRERRHDPVAQPRAAGQQGGHVGQLPGRDGLGEQVRVAPVEDHRDDPAGRAARRVEDVGDLVTVLGQEPLAVRPADRRVEHGEDGRRDVDDASVRVGPSPGLHTWAGREEQAARLHGGEGPVVAGVLVQREARRRHEERGGHLRVVEQLRQRFVCVRTSLLGRVHRPVGVHGPFGIEVREAGGVVAVEQVDAVGGHELTRPAVPVAHAAPGDRPERRVEPVGVVVQAGRNAVDASDGLHRGEAGADGRAGCHAESLPGQAGEHEAKR